MSMRDRLNPALFDLRRSAIREFSNRAARTPGCIRLTLGEPDMDTPGPVRSLVSEALAAGETHYIANNGTKELRDAIAAYEGERHGFSCAGDDVIVTAGATEALFIALFGILEPGDEVIVPVPAFVLYEQIIRLCRAVTVPLATEEDGFQIRSSRLEALVTPRTKAILLNSPNNPTGVVYDRESLEAVRRIAREREIFVICDDVYRELCYGGGYHSFSEFTELRDRILLVQSFSKSWAMTGWRMGWLVADAALRERLELMHQFMVTSTPAPFQRACAAALGEDPGPMRAEYARRRAIVLERLEEMGLPVVRPEGAFYVFPSIAGFGMSSTEFCTRLLEEAGVAVTPGAAFGADDHVRISYCCGEEDLRLGLDRLAGFLEKLEVERHGR